MELERFFIRQEEALLAIVDFQEKLARAIKEDVVERTLENLIKLINLAKIYSIPILLTEQYPKGLGETLKEIRELLSEQPIEKIHFSCMEEEKFSKNLIKTGKRKIILTGMETHVCVLQTALDLLQRDYYVFVPRDAVCSRRKEDWETAINIMHDAGVVVTCTETLIFQILKRAGTPEFKKMLEFLK